MAGLRAPLSTLRHTLAGRRRMTRGQCGLLTLALEALPSSPLCFSFPAFSNARPKAWHDGVGQRHLRPNRTVVGRARRCHWGGIPAVLGCPLAAATKGATMAYEGMI